MAERPAARPARMVKLVLLLLGSDAIRGRWPILAGLGSAGILLAAAIITDAADGVMVVTTETFGSILVLDGVIGLSLAAGPRTPSSRLHLLRSVGLIALGLLIIDLPWHNDIANSVLFGLAFLADGATRIATAAVIRFRRWRWVAGGGALEIALGAIALASWPVTYHNTVPFCVGVLLLLSGTAALRLALTLRRVPRGASVLALPAFAARGWYGGWHGGLSRLSAEPAAAEAEAGARLILHVWTPTGSIAAAQRRPLLDRYVAAVDREGRISTGHAALEMPPSLYISHYPRTEIDRSAVDFARQLRATAENDVPGRFQPGYAEEAAGWTEADVHVVFHRFDAARLRAFWEAYRSDDTYNLTNRNCSVAAAVALDVALEGVAGDRPTLWRALRLMVDPDLWVAAHMRHRAEAMTWTPGLVLDYARALRRVIEPPPWPWRDRAKAALRHLQRRRHEAEAARAEAGATPA